MAIMGRAWGRGPQLWLPLMARSDSIVQDERTLANAVRAQLFYESGPPFPADIFESVKLAGVPGVGVSHSALCKRKECEHLQNCASAVALLSLPGDSDWLVDVVVSFWQSAYSTLSPSIPQSPAMLLPNAQQRHYK